MKRKILFVAIALIAGLLLGYLIFAPSPGAGDPAETHVHEAGESQIWTCSMHPQIRQPEPGNCPICGMELIPMAPSEGGMEPGQFRMSEHALALADVRTTRVGSVSESAGTLSLSGEVQPNENTIATQSAYFDGRIENLQVRTTGEVVRRGQRLATLYAPELVAAQQELLTASGLRETQPELYRAVRKKLELWKLSEQQISQIESSGEVQEYFPVYSDVSGTVTEIAVAAGDYVNKGAMLFRIANLGSVWAEFDAYENQIASIQEGMDIEIRARALPERIFSAKIVFVGPVLNTETRTVVVRAVLPNPGGILKPGMFVSGDVQVGPGNRSDGIVVPESAVLWTGERSVVYVKPDPANPVFEMREVALGPLVSGGYTVLSGLENGQEVVTNGTFTLDAAAQLQGKKSMMNPDGGAAQTGHEGHGAMGGSPGEDPGTPYSEEILRVYPSLLDSYLQLKDALVASDAAAARQAASRATALLREIPEGQAPGELLSAFQSLEEETGLEALREHFIGASDRMIRLGKGIGDLEGTYYIQYCPMADSNQGAYWISGGREILNPYFGDAMLTCGSTVEEL